MIPHRAIIGALLVMVMIGTVSALVTGGGDKYSNRTCFFINNTYGTMPSNYPIAVVLNNSSGTSTDRVIFTGGATRADFKDVNFTYYNGTLALPCWRENHTETATTSSWFFTVPSVATDNSTQVCAYFGNSSQSAESAGFSGQNTFPLFDDYINDAYNKTQRVSSGGHEPAFAAGEGVLDCKMTGSGSCVVGGNSTTSRVPSGNFTKARVKFVHANDMTTMYREGYANLYASWDNVGGATSAVWAYWNGTWRTFGYSYPKTNTFLTLTINGIPGSAGQKANVSVNGTGKVIINDAYLTGVTIPGVVQASNVNNAETFEDWFVAGPYVWPEPVMSVFTIESGAEPPVASFTSSSNPSMNLTEVQFTDTSSNSPTSWAWTFGDGNYTSNTTQNPKHLFVGAGNYTVCLNATNTYGSNVSCANQTVSDTAAPLAMFTKNYAVVLFPRPIQYNDTSTNTPTAWNWSFGDGKYSDSQNPSHQYVKRGKWTVLLNASNAAGYSTNTSTVWILGG